MSYKLLTMLAPIKPNGARPGIKLSSIKGVTIHMTDNWGEGAGAIAHANYLKNSGSDIQASWHYCIDDTYATNSIPESEVAWHCGTEKGNYNTIAIEIAINPDSNLKKACDNAALLTANILKKYNLNYSKVYSHYDWSGKWCPSQLLNGNPYTWDTFKSKVKELYNNDINISNEEDSTISNITSIGVGSTVYFDGKSRCYATSNSDGPGMVPPAGNYKVTYYAPGALCSIHIGSYGWVSLDSCTM